MNTETNSSTPSAPTNGSNAPALKTTAPPPNHTLNPRSCVTCRKRKVRCDKISPCSNCTKAHVQCDFPAPGRAPRRSKNGLAAKGASEREAELLKRLRRLEGVVEELSGQVDVVASEDGNHASSASPPNSGSDKAPVDKSGVRLRMDEGTRTGRISVPLDTQTAKEFGRLMLNEGKSRYVSNTFWASLSEEVDDIRGLLDGDLSDEEDDLSPASNERTTMDMESHQSFMFGYSSSDVDLRPLHPLPSQIPYYWQVYTENIDPIVKIMHKPTMERTISEVKDNLDSLERSTEALMFSLYFGVITSMTDEEVKVNFGLDKKFLLTRYRFAVEQSLARANFLNTSEIVTVQAFVLFLVCVRRHDDSRFVWTLTGLAIRIAQSLGLHRDGAIFGLSPFDTEMRRRLWWQVCVLDVRASEDHGTDPSILEPSYDTKMPLNIDDSMLDPDATEPPEPKIGISELSFSLVRYEICQVSRRLNYTPPGSSFCRERSRNMTLAQKERIVQDCHEMMEKKYLRHFTGSGPLFWVAATVSRLIIAKMGLIIYHPLHNDPGIRNEIPQSTLERLFVASIEIIEYSRLLETEPTTRKWGWLFHTYVQWHAIAYLLGELCIRDLNETAHRAWTVLDIVFKDWGLTLRQTKNGLLWIPIRKLLARARRKRELDIAKQKEELRVLSEKAENEARRPGEVEMGNPLLSSEFTESAEYRDLYQANHYQMSPNSSALTAETWLLSSGRVNGTDFNCTRSEPHSQALNQTQYQPEPRLQTQPDKDPQTHQDPPIQTTQPQQQQQQQLFPNQIPMIMPLNSFGPAIVGGIGDSPDFDVDMEGIATGDIDVEWQGWDDMVREFQVEGERLGVEGAQGRADVLGGMGTWW